MMFWTGMACETMRTPCSIAISSARATLQDLPRCPCSGMPRVHSGACRDSTLQTAAAGSANPAEPARLLDAAISYLEPRSPELIAIGGLREQGKSTIARLLAPAVGAAPGAVILRSDVMRENDDGSA